MNNPSSFASVRCLGSRAMSHDTEIRWCGEEGSLFKKKKKNVCVCVGGGGGGGGRGGGRENRGAFFLAWKVGEIVILAKVLDGLIISYFSKRRARARVCVCVTRQIFDCDDL